jgi:hypothetical protein
MPTIKRFQNAIFEMAASQNRYAGSGGGSGQSPLASPAVIHGGNPGKVYTNITVPTLIQDTNAPVVSDAITVLAPRACAYLILGDVQVLGPTAGAQTFGCQVYVDGVLGTNAASFIANIGAAGSVTLSIFHFEAVQPGKHTFDVRLTTGAATTYTVSAFDLYGFQLG